nr:hypothetical protein BdHM001_35000 [Bdellovibrio sp. HM001]
MSFSKRYEQWKRDTGSHGNMAKNRYVMLLFLEALNEQSQDFVFKGGNLLWHYIKSERPTTDLDLATDVEMEISQVIETIENLRVDGVTFKIAQAEEIRQNGKIGAALQIAFKTEDGAVNKFGIDVVFAVPTHTALVRMITKEIKAASMENIILDKVSACHRFKGGNTRMKDYDDLFRIAESGTEIRPLVLVELARARGIDLKLDQSIADDLESEYSKYLGYKANKGAKTLPRTISELIEIVNVFLMDVTKLAQR